MAKQLTKEATELVANRFKLLSEPMRLRILQALQEGERSVAELVAMIEASQPNISKHLRMLQDAGVLNRRQQGTTVFYSIADQSIFTLCEVVCGSIENHHNQQAGAFSNSWPNRKPEPLSGRIQ